MSISGGGFNRSAQHFIFPEKDSVQAMVLWSWTNSQLTESSRCGTAGNAASHPTMRIYYGIERITTGSGLWFRAALARPSQYSATSGSRLSVTALYPRRAAMSLRRYQQDIVAGSTMARSGRLGSCRHSPCIQPVPGISGKRGLPGRWRSRVRGRRPSTVHLATVPARRR